MFFLFLLLVLLLTFSFLLSQVRVALAELDAAAAGAISSSPPATPSAAAAAAAAGSGAKEHWASVRQNIGGRPGSVPANGRRMYTAGSNDRRERSSSNSGVSQGVQQQQQQQLSSSSSSSLPSSQDAPVCTQSMRYDEEVRKFAVFIAAPVMHNLTPITAASKQSSGGGGGGGGGRGKGKEKGSASSIINSVDGASTKFVGIEGFIRYAAAIGVAINPERYLFATSSDSELELSKKEAAEPAEAAAAEAPAAPHSGAALTMMQERRRKRAAVVNEPVRGLDAENRAIMSKALNSKVAASMTVERKVAWYKDCHKESDAVRIKALTARLAALRGPRDVGEKIGGGKGGGGVRGGGGGGGEAPLPVKSRSGVSRGSTWRQCYDLKWNSADAF